MTVVVALLLVNGVLGAVDTLWYHEHRAGLARRAEHHRAELRLHAGRDAVYALLYGTIGWIAWNGTWAVALTALLAAEIVITMSDFVVEDRTRSLTAGERVLHGVMAVVYGSMLAGLAPQLVGWLGAPTSLAPHPDAVPAPLAWTATAFGIGIAVSGARDAHAARRAAPIRRGTTRSDR